MKCSNELYKCAIKPITNSNPLYSHSKFVRVCIYLKYCRVFMAPWLLMTGSGLDLLTPSFTINNNYSAIANLPTSQITRPRSILVLRCTPTTASLGNPSVLTYNSSARIPRKTRFFCCPRMRVYWPVTYQWMPYCWERNSGTVFTEPLPGNDHMRYSMIDYAAKVFYSLLQWLNLHENYSFHCFSKRFPLGRWSRRYLLNSNCLKIWFGLFF
jgi:hypothetical protein